MNISLEENNIKLTYYPEDQFNAIYLESESDDGWIEFEWDYSYADVVYEYFGDTEKSRAFVMKIAEQRSK